ncbi:hypothetical protein ATANTOWER_005948 [Ataeniobius toweri]|uniref:Uncharacterized protein n=1 Tax=Ataeniobius toweri TaxID=208326 RepID=A0ABU7AWW7_9TELE|nr:hypothetical protein [Ataeniobius toweri]
MLHVYFFVLFTPCWKMLFVYAKLSLFMSSNVYYANPVQDCSFLPCLVHACFHVSPSCYLWKDVPQTSQSSNDKIMIPPSCNLNMDIRVTGDLVPISSDLQARGGVHPGQFVIAGQHRDIQDKQPCIHPFIPKGNLDQLT